MSVKKAQVLSGINTNPWLWECAPPRRQGGIGILVTEFSKNADTVASEKKPSLWGGLQRRVHVGHWKAITHSVSVGCVCVCGHPCQGGTLLRSVHAGAPWPASRMVICVCVCVCGRWIYNKSPQMFPQWSKTCYFLACGDIVQVPTI